MPGFRFLAEDTYSTIMGAEAERDFEQTVVGVSFGTLARLEVGFGVSPKPIGGPACNCTKSNSGYGAAYGVISRDIASIPY